MQAHFYSHGIQAQEIVYCEICGAGWSVDAYGPTMVYRMAQKCRDQHTEDGNADDTAAKTYFLSGGQFGYVRKRKGGKGYEESEGYSGRCEGAAECLRDRL